jgi:hypothetical protein
VARNPDPALPLTSIKGVTRTLDDWATVFHLAIVLLPPRVEAAAFVPVIERMFRTLGDSDARTCICVSGNEHIARRLLGRAADDWLVFCDPDSTLASSLGLERLPALVHLRQDTTLVEVAQGWSASDWQRVADEIARHQHWTAPVLAAPGNPPPTPGWPLSA